MEDTSLNDAMDELESAEDFLAYFGIDYDPAVVRVNRLHILQRFHDYLAKAGGPGEAEAAGLLRRAYDDFVRSDARTEKVFRVFHMQEPQTAFVPLASLTIAGAKAVAPVAQAGGCGCGGQGVCHSSAATSRS